MGAILAAVWSGTATAVAPGLRILLRRRARRGKEIPARLAERFGVDETPRPDGRIVWVHAASVGETASVLPVLSELTAMAADVTILLTTGTVTSAELLGKRLPVLGLCGHVLHRFAPLDVPGWIARFLDHWRPDLACFVESELWPNQVAACRSRGIPMMLVNARLSSRSFRAWRRAPSLARQVLDGFDCIQARGAEDADRFRQLGARRVETPGDLKFAAPPLPADEAELSRLRHVLGGRPAWLAASTHGGEESLVADAHARIAAVHAGLVTIIAPRHPERGAALAAELAAPRRSAGKGPPDHGLWLADTLGEMGLWYRLVSVAFVGRSLLPPGGGQNPLEPARLGCAIAVGPHTGNFSDHVSLLREAGALEQVADANALAAFVCAMLADPARRARMGEQAAAVVHRHEDLPNRTARSLLALMR